MGILTPAQGEEEAPAEDNALKEVRADGGGVVKKTQLRSEEAAFKEQGDARYVLQKVRAAAWRGG